MRRGWVSAVVFPLTPSSWWFSWLRHPLSPVVDPVNPLQSASPAGISPFRRLVHPGTSRAVDLPPCAVWYPSTSLRDSARFPAVSRLPCPRSCSPRPIQCPEGPFSENSPFRLVETPKMGVCVWLCLRWWGCVRRHGIRSMLQTTGGHRPLGVRHDRPPACSASGGVGGRPEGWAVTDQPRCVMVHVKFSELDR